MELNEAIERNYNKWMERVKTFTPENEAGDVLDTVLLSLLERGINVEDLDCLDCYIISSCKIAYRSKNSPYNRELERHIKTVDFDEAVENGDYVEEPEEEKEDEIDIIKTIDESPFSWWEKEVFKRKILENGGKTLKQMAEECNLSPHQVWYSYRKIKNYLKNKISDNGY